MSGLTRGFIETRHFPECTCHGRHIFVAISPADNAVFDLVHQSADGQGDAQIPCRLKGDTQILVVQSDPKPQRVSIVDHIHSPV